MPGYIFNSNTVGFWKFGKFPQWNTNSISSSESSAYIFNNDKKEFDPASTTGIIVSPGDLVKENKIYRSRPSSILIPESNCIYCNLPASLKDYNSKSINLGSSGGIRTLLNGFTVEFWVYVKSGTNTTVNPVNYRTITQSGLFSSTVGAYTVSTFSNPFLFSYGSISNNLAETTLYYNRFNAGSVSSAQNSVYKYYETYININLGYCCHTKRFGIDAFTVRTMATSGYVNQSYQPTIQGLYSSYSTNNGYHPPNRWYHIALTFENNSANSTSNHGQPKLVWFINGIKTREFTFSGYSGDVGGIHIKSNPIFRDSGSYIALGNRLPAGNGNNYIYNFNSIDPSNSSQFLENSNFQDVIIDDLRVTKGILYTTNFTPPGLSGYQLLYVNNDVYGYDDTCQFVKIAPDWDSKTDAAKWSIIKTMSNYMDITADDAKSVVTGPSDDIHLEVYDDENNQKECYIIAESYETTVIPSSLLDNPIPGSEVRGLEFYSSLTEDSYIKVLLTKDLSTYQTYDFTNSQWVNCDIVDISTQGIPIDQVKDIPKADMTSLGDSFAFAYFLHLEPYESDCSVDKLDITISLTYGWEHQNQSKANYEYPMLSQLKVVFYEDGDFKVNYMDKP